MWIGLWIILGAFLWFSGFFRAGSFEEKGPPISKAFVRPPFLIYLLCGRPKALNIPKGVVALRSLITQLQGILFVAYGLAYDFLPSHDFNFQMIIMFFAVIAIFLFCWLLYKRYPYLENNS